MRKILLFCLLAIASFAFAKEEKWLDEAAKVIITRAESEAAHKLKTDAERQAFLKDFWAKRDPSPGTPENEHKKEIEARIKQVNEVMKSDKSYENDLGLTLLLLGAPDEHQKHDDKASSVPGGQEEQVEDESAGRQRQLLIYRKLPSEISSGELKIEFVSSGHGWIFADGKRAHEILEKAKQWDLKTTQAKSSTPGQTTASQPTTTAQQPSATQQTPSQSAPKQQPTPAQPTAPVEGPVKTPALKSALDAAAGGTAPKAIAVNALVDSFMTSDGQVFATIAVDSESAPSHVGIRVLGSSGAVVKEMEMPFSNPQETSGKFQAQIPLQPGNYSIVLAVASGDKTGGIKQELKIPDYANKLSLSSVILAKKFTQLPEAKPEKEPYTFGKIKLDPSIDRVFSKTDEMMVFYEIYNFQAASGGKPDLQVVYTFQKGTDPPKSSAPAAAEGLVTGKKMTVPTGFPLSSFPPGEYKLTVAVTDKGSNQTVTEETSFTIQ